MRLAIIGTAGRKDDSKKLSAKSFQKMCSIAREVATNIGATHLVSGGAAWADHVAVRLTLDKVIPSERLTLYLPAHFTPAGFDTTTRDGSTSAYYHRLFTIALDHNSIIDLHQARDHGANFVINQKGFFARNAQVAENCDAILAFTFGDGPAWKPVQFSGKTTSFEAGLKDGGTAHTFDRCHAPIKIHVPLGPA